MSSTHDSAGRPIVVAASSPNIVAPAWLKSTTRSSSSSTRMRSSNRSSRAARATGARSSSRCLSKARAASTLVIGKRIGA